MNIFKNILKKIFKDFYKFEVNGEKYKKKFDHKRRKEDIWSHYYLLMKIKILICTYNKLKEKKWKFQNFGEN